MKAVVAAFNQEKALVGAFSVITNLWMELFQALVRSVWLLSGLHNQHSMVFSSKGFNQGQEQHQLCLMNNVDTDIYRHGYYLHGYLAARESAVSGQHGSIINTPFYCDPRYVHDVGLKTWYVGCWREIEIYIYVNTLHFLRQNCHD